MDVVVGVNGVDHGLASVVFLYAASGIVIEVSQRYSSLEQIPPICYLVEEEAQIFRYSSSFNIIDLIKPCQCPLQKVDYDLVVEQRKNVCSTTSKIEKTGSVLLVVFFDIIIDY